MEKPRITATAATSDPEDTGQRFSPEHLSSVDALRGIAALTVVCLHVTLVPSPHLGTPNWLRPLVLAGGTGVTMFFVVSAFTLSISWFSRKDGAHPIRNFYIRRLFRIVPLFYCLLAVTFFRDGYYWHVKHSVNEIVINACMVFNLLPQYSTGIVWASWTIGVEMLFYLMFPLVVKAASRVARLVVCFIATLIVALIFYLGVQHTDLPADLRGQYVATGLAMHLPVFVLGIAAYALHRSKLFTQWGSVRVGGILVVMALILHFAFSYGGIYYLGRSGADWSAPAWVLLVLGLVMNPMWPIVNAVTRFYGRISYSVYLNHPIIILLLMPHFPWVYRHVPDDGLAWFICFVATLSVLTPWAFVTYRLIEQPGIRLGSRLIKSLERPTTVGEPSVIVGK